MEKIKERPILFSAPMVRATLEGRKTQTRRVIKPQPMDHHWEGDQQHRLDVKLLEIDGGLAVRFQHILEGVNYEEPEWVKCPYGTIGDRLWARETFSLYSHPMHPRVYYRADEKNDDGYLKWKPSIHMPRWASRINLEIKDIRVEQLQFISEEECFAEGIDEEGEVFSLSQNILDNMGGTPGATHDIPDSSPAKAEFKALWYSINGKTYPWESNPWVWVVEFKIIKA